MVTASQVISFVMIFNLDQCRMGGGGEVEFSSGGLWLLLAALSLTPGFLYRSLLSLYAVMTFHDFRCPDRSAQNT